MAQAGQRDEARACLREIVQGEPDSELAWLWLASVAEDRAEYARAAREVLRINPANAQAQQMLAQMRPASAAPSALLRLAWPLLIGGLLAVLVGVIGYTTYALLVDDEDEATRRVRLTIDEARVSVAVPESWYAAVESDEDWDAQWNALNEALPLHEAGMASLIAAAAQAGVELPWDDNWRDVEVRVKSVLATNRPEDDGEGDEAFVVLERVRHTASLADADLYFIETDPEALRRDGMPASLTLVGVVDAGELGLASTTCEAVSEWLHALDRQRLQSGDRSLKQVVSLPWGGGRCAVRQERLATLAPPDDDTPLRLFGEVDAPAAVRIVTLHLPVSRYEVAIWRVVVPAGRDATYEPLIDRLLDTARVTPP